MDAIKDPWMVEEGSVPATTRQKVLGWPYIAPWSTFLEVSVSWASENTVFSETAGPRRQPVAEISGRI